MKNKKYVMINILVVVVACLVAGILIILNVNKMVNNKNNENIMENLEKIQNISNGEQNQNEEENQDINEIEKLKTDSKRTGNTDIYEVQDEYNGRKTLTVKPSLQYEVAFAGIIKGSKPEMSELEDIYNENAHKNNGIWVEENSREKILKTLDNDEMFNSKYVIDENGFIKIENKNRQNDNDKNLEKTINSGKQFALDVKNSYYMIDDVTGEITEYNYTDFDDSDSCSYVADSKNNKFIIFINENNGGKLDNSTIIRDVIELLTNIE